MKKKYECDVDKIREAVKDSVNFTEVLKKLKNQDKVITLKH